MERSFLKRLNIEISYPAIPLLGIYSKEVGLFPALTFTAALFTIARYGNNLNVHQPMSE